jgi:hypothetical protein
MKIRTAIIMLVLFAAFLTAPDFVRPEETEEDKEAAGNAGAAADSEKRKLKNLLEEFKGDDDAKAEKAAEQLVEKGEEAVRPLMKLLDAKDRALAARAEATLKKIGVVDGLYVRTALFHEKFLPHEPIGVRFIFRNYGAKNITVFNPARLDNPGFGFSLSLSNEKSGKGTAKIEMNAALRPAGLGRDNFAVLKPGESFEEIVTLRRLFNLRDVGTADYVIKGKYSGKTGHNKAITANKRLGVDNLFEGEIEARPLSFKVRDVEVPVPDKEKKTQLEKWIRELGDEEYKIRLAAGKNLEKEGLVALPFLRKALDNPDIQVRATAQRLTRKLTEDREKMVTFLGIHMSAAPDGRGVRVVGTFADSQAGKFGLKPGDIIVGVGDVRVPGEDFNNRATFIRKQVQCRRKGDKIRLTVRRGSTEKVLEILLGETLKESLEG